MPKIFVIGNSNTDSSISSNYKLAPRLRAIKQNKLIIHMLMSFLLLYSPKSRSNVRIKNMEKMVYFLNHIGFVVKTAINQFNAISFILAF